MKYLLLFSLLIGPALAHDKDVKTVANRLAYGVFKAKKNHPWPFPLLSIGHNMQSYQNYGDPYWHDGLDIRSREDQPIYAAAGGKVVNIENYVKGNPLYWEIAILDNDGFVWKYHHVSEKSIPAEVKEAYKTGAKIPEGTLIGDVVRWPISSFGEVYHHLHLLVVGKDGRYINPFLLMEPLPDRTAPVIKKIGIAKGHSPIKGSEVSGGHSIFIEASDLTLHDKFILPPHKISYRLNRGAEKTVWEFIHLPSGSNDKDFINDFYLKGTCGDYRCRKFYFNLNFSMAKPRDQFSLKAGKQEIEVTVEDVVGNKSSSTFNWTVF